MKTVKLSSWQITVLEDGIVQLEKANRITVEASKELKRLLKSALVVKIELESQS